MYYNIVMHLYKAKILRKNRAKGNKAITDTLTTRCSSPPQGNKLTMTNMQEKVNNIGYINVNCHMGKTKL